MNYVQSLVFILQENLLNCGSRFVHLKGDIMLRSVKLLRFVLCLTLLLSIISAQVVNQDYPLGRIYLSNGFTIEGSNLRMSSESVTIEVMGQDQQFILTDVVQVMAKQDKAKRYGNICAAVCVGCNLLPFLAMSLASSSDTESETSSDETISVVIGAALWGGVSYGVGYLLGQASDDWQVVYLNRG